MTDEGAGAEVSRLLAGAGWWASARLEVVVGAALGPLLPAGAARLVLRRPLMAVPAGIRVEDDHGRPLVRRLGAGPHDAVPDLTALLDPLAVVTGLPPAAGALPARARRDAAAAAGVETAARSTQEGRQVVRAVLTGLGPTAGRPAGSPLEVVLDRDGGLPLRAGVPGAPPLLVLRLLDLDPRLDDDVFGP